MTTLPFPLVASEMATIRGEIVNSIDMEAAMSTRQDLAETGKNRRWTVLQIDARPDLEPSDLSREEPSATTKRSRPSPANGFRAAKRPRRSLRFDRSRRPLTIDVGELHGDLKDKSEEELHFAFWEAKKQKPRERDTK